MPRRPVGTIDPVPIKCNCTALRLVVGRCDGGSWGAGEVVVKGLAAKYCERMGGVAVVARAPVWNLNLCIASLGEVGEGTR